MHSHHTDRTDAIEPGMRSNVLHRILVDGGSRGDGTPPASAGSTLFKRLTENDKSVPVTPTDQVKEAVKDGRISSNEQTAFDRSPDIKAIVKDEQARLEKAVQVAGGAPRQNGAIVTPGQAIPTEHETRSRDLAATKADGRDLAGLDAKIKDHQGTAAGLEVLEQERSQRAGSEAQVAAVIEDRESLVGTLEAEKHDLKHSGSSDAADDYQALRTDAQPWIDQFNANNGQFYEGNDLFGDDWSTSEVDFNRLAERFSDDPGKLQEFATVQGKDDGDDIASKSAAEYREYLGQRSGGDAEQIDARFQAAQELTKIFGRYNTARSSTEETGGRIGEIDEQVGALNQLNEQDLASLSAETIAGLEAANKQTPGIIENENARENEPPKTEQETTSPDSTDSKPADGVDATPKGSESSAPATELEPKIDYSTPERRSDVLAQAQARNLLPTDNTTFGADGEAVYKVQRGDSYWRISDMSDGKDSS